MFGHSNEPVNLIRDVSAVIIPVGETVTLREGTEGFIVQALGGSFTIYVEGNLFRISGADADALGERTRTTTRHSRERYQRRHRERHLGPA